MRPLYTGDEYAGDGYQHDGYQHDEPDNPDDDGLGCCRGVLAAAVIAGVFWFVVGAILRLMFWGVS